MNDQTIRRTYRYRIYPSRAQTARLNETLRLCCELYNAALQERRDAYRLERKTIRYFEQSNQLPDVKLARPEFKGVHSQVCRTCSAGWTRLTRRSSTAFGPVKRQGFPASARPDTTTASHNRSR